MRYFALVAFALGTLGAGPAPSATPNDHPNQAEQQFVSNVSAALLRRYPTTAKAKAGGYIQMRKLDVDNTIIYTNFRYHAITLAHPNFLWYDRNGKLVGVDYEIPLSDSPQTPSAARYPVAKSRWTTIPEHVHFSYKLGAVMVLKGGKVYPDLRKEPITSKALRAHGMLPRGASLLWATYHPACWDLGFWVVPNSNGAFAEKNPAVR